ncbi:MAG: DUF4350 domain-containing protein [Myxococcota bacterium]
MRGLPIVLAGLVVVFVGERIALRSELSWTGAFVLALALGMLLDEARRKVHPLGRLRVGAAMGVAAAMATYGASTSLGLDLLGVPIGHALERTLSLSWPAILSGSLVFWIVVERRGRSLPAAAFGPLTLSRIRDAGFRALAVVCVVVGAMALNVAADARDLRVDVSYLKVTEPSDTSRRMVRALGEPVRALLLYEEQNEVFRRIAPFFETLAEESEFFETERIDHAFAPTLVRERRLSGNGYVALVLGANSEVIEIGQELASSRSKLRTLDGHFQEAFSRLAQPRREVYFTVGHGERGFGGEEAPDERLERFVRSLRRSNIVPRELGVASGLAQGISRTVPMVAIAGSRDPWTPEELESIARYVKRGGRLLVLVDGEAGGALDPLLDGFGLGLAEGVLTSEEHSVPRTRSEADRTRIYTSRFAEHPTVREARAQRGRHAVTLRAGAALTRTETPPGVSAVFPLRTENTTWRDLNDDRTRNEDEQAEASPILAAVTVHNPEGQEGRVVVIGESSFAGNDLITYRGNFFVLGDSLQWLMGDLEGPIEVVVGATSSEEDHPMAFRAEDDALVFYGTSFGVPLPLLIAGLVLARQRRKERSEA